MQQGKLDSDGALLSLPPFPNSQPVTKYENNDGFSQLLSVKTKGLLGQRVMRMGFEGSQPAHEKDRGEKIDPKILIQTEVMGLGNDCTVNIAPPYHTLILMSN